MATESTAATAKKRTRGPSRGETFERRVAEWRELDRRNPRAVERRALWLLRAAELIAPLALVIGVGLCALAVWILVASKGAAPQRPGQSGSRDMVKLAIASGVFGLIILWQVARAWFLAHRIADGVRVTPRNAPQLFERVSGLAQKLSARRPDRVLLVDDLVAATMAVPRLIPFTRPRVVLVIGMPLLELLSPAQFDSVIAHELAHQQPGDFKLSGRIGSLVTFWSSIAEKSQGRVFLVHSVITWFVDRLQAATLASSRRIEFACDTAAAQLVGPQVACAALFRLAAYHRLFEGWQRETVREAIGNGSFSYRDAVSRRMAWFQAPPGEAAFRRLVVSLRTPADDLSSHPSLRERCEAILKTSVDPERTSVPNGSPSAMSILFGQVPESNALLAGVIEQTQAEITGVAESLRPARTRLAELDASMATRAPSPDRDPILEGTIDEWLQASLIAEPEERSIERARRAIELRPTYGDAWAVYAMLLLDEDRDDGIAAAGEASRLGTMHSTMVAASLAAYYGRQGRESDAQTASRLARRSAESDEEIGDALVHPPKADQLLAHDLPPEVVALLAAAAKPVRGVGRVWLVGRTVKGLRGGMTYLVIAEPKTMSFRYDADGTKVAGEVLTKCHQAVKLPAALLSFPWSSLSRSVRKRIREVGQGL
jgi:Zn-dependent protease with chaperone function